jgi:hypothetical protein
MGGRTHPHIEQASTARLTELLHGKDPELRHIYLNIHRLMLEALPDVCYSTDCTDGETAYGIRQYGYDGWGMAVVAAHSRWVSLTFMHGADLVDRAGILEGTKRMRHVRLQSIEQFEQYKDDIRLLIEMASALHQG